MGRIANGAIIFICAIFLACCARNDPPLREKNAAESRVASTSSSTPATPATPATTATTATGAQRANDPIARAPRVAAARMRRNAAHAAANAAGVL